MKLLPEFLRLRCVLLPLLLGASGCGLSDYHDRMDAQRKRIQAFDETHALLDDPLEHQQSDGEKDEKAGWPFEFFLRLPKGFGTTPRDKTQYLKDFAMFHYTGTEPGVSMFVAASAVADPKDPKTEVKGRYLPGNFRIFVRLALEGFYEKNRKIKYTFQESAQPIKTEFLAFTAYPDPAKPAKVVYTHQYTYTDEGNTKLAEHIAFDVYIHEAAGKQVCIVVHRPVRPTERLTKSIEACLGTLDVSSDAGHKRAQFKKTKGP